MTDKPSDPTLFDDDLDQGDRAGEARDEEPGDLAAPTTPDASPDRAGGPARGRIAVATSGEPAAVGPAADLFELGAASVALRGARAGAKRAGTARELPFSKQFTPKQVKSLGEFLRIVATNAGSAATVQTALHEYLRPTVTSETATYNAVLSASHYGLVTRERDALTDFGRAMLALPSDDERHRQFAKHILLNLNGVELVIGVHKLGLAGVRLIKSPLATYFIDRGLASNKDGTDINAIGEWLEAAGVIEPGGWYRIDEGAFADLAEIDIGTAERLAGVSAANQAILEQLALQPGHVSDSGEIQRLLTGRTDVVIEGPAFVTRHINPLVAVGLLERAPAAAGERLRGTRFRGTALFEERVVAHLLDRFRRYGVAVSGPELEQPFAVLVEDLRHGATTDIRGRALELFALRLLHRLGLQRITFRPRPRNAEEIDGTAEGLAPVHTRWQVQCKNTASLDADHVAKEIGVAVRNRSTVVLLVTTGRLSDPARDFVRGVLEGSAYTIIVWEGRDVEALAADEGEVWRLLDREARRAQAIRAGVLGQLAAAVERGQAELAVEVASTAANPEEVAEAPGTGIQQDFARPESDPSRE